MDRNRGYRYGQIRQYAFFLPFLLFLSCVEGQTPTLFASHKKVELGENVTVNCVVEINNDILFEVNNTQVADCPLPALGLPCNPNIIEQNTTSGETVWTLEAAEKYDGTWTCKRRSGTSSPPVNIRMYKCPKAITSELGISSNLVLNETASVSITFQVDCAYPTNNLEMSLIFVSPAHSKSTTLDCKTVTGSCTSGSAYECSKDISSALNLMVETNYTLFVESTVLPSVSCSRLPIFQAFAILFEEKGNLLTSEESTTKPNTAFISISTVATKLNTKEEMKQHTTTPSKTDTFTGTTNVLIIHEPENVLTPIAISVSVTCFILVVITIAGISLMINKQRLKRKRKKNSEIYSDKDASSMKRHGMSKKTINTKFEGKEPSRNIPFQSQLNRKETNIYPYYSYDDEIYIYRGRETEVLGHRENVFRMHDGGRREAQSFGRQTMPVQYYKTHNIGLHRPEGTVYYSDSDHTKRVYNSNYSFYSG